MSRIDLPLTGTTIRLYIEVVDEPITKAVILLIAQSTRTYRDVRHRPC
jgi:hypothetical protein